MRLLKDMIQHIDYEIDKKKYRDIFYNNIQEHGDWHWSVPELQSLYWYRLMLPNDSPLRVLVRDVEEELNLIGLNNYPRYNYYFPNTKLPHHMDVDKMVAININLFDTIPIIHVEHKQYPYQCALIDTGHINHGIEPDKNPRLILKLCLRNPHDEVMTRLDKYGLLCDRMIT